MAQVVEHSLAIPDTTKKKKCSSQGGSDRVSLGSGLGSPKTPLAPTHQIDFHTVASQPVPCPGRLLLTFLPGPPHPVTPVTPMLPSTFL
jgi:hypothetical protein